MRNPKHYACLCALTFNRIKEVEEGVIGDLFGNSADSATPFMLLLLLNGFHCHVLPLVPIYLTARERKYKKVRGGKKQIRKKKAEVGRPAKKRMICGMQKQIYIENTKKINK